MSSRPSTGPPPTLGTNDTTTPAEGALFSLTCPGGPGMTSLLSTGPHRPRTLDRRPILPIRPDILKPVLLRPVSTLCPPAVLQAFDHYIAPSVVSPSLPCRQFASHISKSHQLQVRQSEATGDPALQSEPQPGPAKLLVESPAAAKAGEPKRLYHVPSPEQVVPFPADEHGRFVWLHGRDGLSQCRHCLRKCNTWHDLRVHITTKACSVLAPDGYTELPAKLNLNPRPLFHQPDLQAMLTEAWEQVASWIKLHRPRAQHHCPLCHQWLLQPRGLRAHIKAKHAPLSVHCAEAVQRMQDHRRLLALGKTCRYCLLQLSGAPIKHATECSVLFLVVHFLQAMHAALAPSQVLPTRPTLPAADGDIPARAPRNWMPSMRR